MWDFFVQHLLGVAPPNWNAMPAAARAVDGDGRDAASAFGPSWESIRASFESRMP